MTNYLKSGIVTAIACCPHVCKDEVFLTLQEKKRLSRQADIDWVLVNYSESIATAAQLIKKRRVTEVKGVLC